VTLEPPSWSGWTWIEEQQQYYRARRGPSGEWEYEYATAQTPTILAKETPRYIPSTTEYFTNPDAVYSPTPAYTYVPSASGDNAGYVTVPTCDQMTINSVATEDGAAQKAPDSAAIAPPEDKEKKKAAESNATPSMHLEKESITKKDKHPEEKGTKNSEWKG